MTDRLWLVKKELVSCELFYFALPNPDAWSTMDPKAAQRFTQGEALAVAGAISRVLGEVWYEHRMLPQDLTEQEMDTVDLAAPDLEPRVAKLERTVAHISEYLILNPAKTVVRGDDKALEQFTGVVHE